MLGKKREGQDAEGQAGQEVVHFGHRAGLSRVVAEKSTMNKLLSILDNTNHPLDNTIPIRGAVLLVDLSPEGEATPSELFCSKRH